MKDKGKLDNDLLSILTSVATLCPRYSYILPFAPLPEESKVTNVTIENLIIILILKKCKREK